MHAKISKCSFYQRKIHYLAHIISKQGIVVDLENIEVIGGWPTLKNRAKVISFTGLARYYRIFIEGFH
jgi:hypothetical protein